MPRPMLMRHFLDPTMFSIELVYSLLIIVLCVMIYFKTKDMYDLTKHKGIMYFRNTFLFFALAYLFRFVFQLIRLTDNTFDFQIFPRHIMGPLSLVFIGYLGTMAIFSLTLSTVWKKIRGKYFTYLIHFIALGIVVLVFIFRSPVMLTTSHLILFAFAVFMSYFNHKKSKKFSQLFRIYVLLFLFWVFNLHVLGPKHLIPFELRIVFYIISIGIFILIFNKVNKRIK